ncbi:transposase [Aliarcobacter butzleri]|uniref:IS256 family transposase, variant Zn-binding type n=1 Tax=Aliarcobacter butzleri TaxID=28197 RepID=UPI0021B5787B|nr:transposase [Aliarcobacter butzleri]MCT7574284.1 transposase [Aliarcobacter butzleri]
MGTLVFMDSITHEILIWKHIQTERVDDYKYLLVELLNLGYTILSVTIDGKRGVNSVFKDYPVQMCHFHQKRIIQRYITLYPKLEASQELKKIMTRLKYSDENRFTKALDIWYIKYKSFLDEITIHPDSQKSSYTHKKLVAAYRSIRNNLPYLFTYKNYKKLNLSNTTNLIEGGVFSPLKILIKIHRGLSKSLKLKIVDDYLVSYKKKE